MTATLGTIFIAGAKIGCTGPSGKIKWIAESMDTPNAILRAIKARKEIFEGDDVWVKGHVSGEHIYSWPEILKCLKEIGE